MDNLHLRRVLGRFTTGVTIVSCVDATGRYTGLTVNSFNVLSLQPPLILWSLRATSPMLLAFGAAQRFAVNVLAESQIELSRRFALRDNDRFDPDIWSLGVHGAPVLAGSAAVFECETASHQAAGDHVLFIGGVLACTESPLPPLVFQSGHYHRLGDEL